MFSLALFIVFSSEIKALNEEETSELRWAKLYDGTYDWGTTTIYLNDHPQNILCNDDGSLCITGSSFSIGYPEELFKDIMLKSDTDGNYEEAEFSITPSLGGELVLTANRYSTEAIEYDNGHVIQTRCAPTAVGVEEPFWGVILDHSNLDENERPNDWPVELAIDANSDVVVAGTYATSNGFHASPRYVTVKYNGQTGTELWRRYSDQFNRNLYDMVLDYDGNVLVTGTGGTIKYDTDGNVVCVIQDVGYIIDVDVEGNFYVVNQTSQSGININSQYYSHSDICVTKYTPNGYKMWSQTYGSDLRDSLGQYSDETVALWNAFIEVDSRNNVYVVCDIDFDNAISGSANAAVVKFDNTGEIQWATILESDYIDSIELDNMGNVYLAGDSFVSKFDSFDGHLIWEEEIPGDFSDIVINEENNVFVIGSVNSPNSPQPSIRHLDLAVLKIAQMNSDDVVIVQVPVNDQQRRFSTMLNVEADRGELVRSYSEISSTNIEESPIITLDGGASISLEGRLHDPITGGQLVLEINLDTTNVIYIIDVTPFRPHPPVASFTCPDEVSLGTDEEFKRVDFNPDASYALPPARIERYDWDFNGDGVVDEIVSDPDTISWAFSLGEHRISLTVTDNFGRTGSYQQDLRVVEAGGFTISPVTPSVVAVVEAIIIGILVMIILMQKYGWSPWGPIGPKPR